MQRKKKEPLSDPMSEIVRDVMIAAGIILTVIGLLVGLCVAVITTAIKDASAEEVAKVPHINEVQLTEAGCDVFAETIRAVAYWRDHKVPMGSTEWEFEQTAKDRAFKGEIVIEGSVEWLISEVRWVYFNPQMTMVQLASEARRRCTGAQGRVRDFRLPRF